MQPALVHYEFHIWFSLRFSVDNEHLVLTIICDPILLYDIDQSNNVGDGSLAESNVFVIARHFCLVGHYHGITVDLESHTAAGLERLCDQFRVAKKIHFGQTVHNGFFMQPVTGHREVQVQQQHETQDKRWYHCSELQGKYGGLSQIVLVQQESHHSHLSFVKHYTAISDHLW